MQWVNNGQKTLSCSASKTQFNYIGFPDVYLSLLPISVSPNFNKKLWYQKKSIAWQQQTYKWMLDEISRVLQTKLGFASDKEPGINDATQWNPHPLVPKDISKRYISFGYLMSVALYLLNSSVKQPCDQKRN